MADSHRPCPGTSGPLPLDVSLRDENVASIVERGPLPLPLPLPLPAPLPELCAFSGNVLSGGAIMPVLPPLSTWPDKPSPYRYASVPLPEDPGAGADPGADAT